MGRFTIPPLPSEQRFWHSVARRFITTPGLTLAIVPHAMNTKANRALLRHLVCYPDDTDTMLCDQAPDSAHVQVLGFALDDSPMACDGQQAIASIRDHVGDSPYRGDESDTTYIITHGACVGPERSLDRWAAHFLEGWPGDWRGPTSALRCCAIISAPFPHGVPPVEGCTTLVPDPPTREELHAAIYDRVVRLWNTHDRRLHAYVCSAVVDMADGIPNLAEQALETLYEEWQAGRIHHDDWRPGWCVNHHAVNKVREILHTFGIEPSVAQAHGGGGATDPRHETISLAYQLWTHDLWRRVGESTDIWQGLTHIARVALDAAEHERLFSFVPHSSLDVLMSTLRAEQHIKRYIAQRLRQPAFRAMFESVLDRTTDKEPDSFRSRILAETHKTPDYWERYHPTIEAHQRSTAETMLAICTFGMLAAMLRQMLPDRYDKWRAMLKQTVTARNTAAHGGSFSINDYTRIDSDVAVLLQELPSLSFRTV